MSFLMKKVVYELQVGTEKKVLNDWELNELKNELYATEDWRVLAVLGLKIHAIKKFREMAGALGGSVGLKEAKDAVELFCSDWRSPEGALNSYLGMVREQENKRQK